MTNDIAVQVDHVWKKFRKGELHDSLRELIPAVAKRLLGRGPKADELGQREFWALKDISFEVRAGQSLGVIGPNGAGKSTLLKLLSRISKPTRGQYRVNGRVSALIEVGAGFHQDLTGRENIYLNGTILGMKRAEIQAKEDQIIAFSGVDDFIDTPVKRYSSGMKARLGFAIAAHMEPDVLLVDEVLSVGDTKFRHKCVQHMTELIHSNVTVIFISHLLEQVRDMCPNTIVLDHGQVVYHGPTDGAIVRYLEALNRAEANSQPSDAEIRNIQLVDTHGKEILQWHVAQPGTVQFELVLRRKIHNPSININLSTASGVYLGTASSFRQGLAISPDPGVYCVRFTLDPMPLPEGHFTMELKLNELATRTCLWSSTQPRMITVIGDGQPSGLIRCDGTWQLVSTPGSAPLAAAV